MRVSVVLPQNYLPKIPPASLGYLTGTLKNAGFEVDTIDFNVTTTLKTKIIDRILKSKYGSPVMAKYSPEYYLSSVFLGYTSFFDDASKMIYPIYKMAMTDMARRIISKKPEVVGFSTYTSTYLNALVLAKLIKERRPDTKIVLGGPQATGFRKKNFLFSNHIDAVVTYEGELSLTEFCKNLEEGKSVLDIPGTIVKENGENGNENMKIIENKDRKEANLDDLPFPDYSWAKLDKYGMKNTLPIVSSRGCIYNCAYCEERKFWRDGYRERTAQNVFNEIKERDVKNFVFSESLMNAHPERLEKLSKMIIDEGLEISWEGNSRVTGLTLELLEVMKKAGCKRLYLGIESGCQEVLNRMRKGITLEQVRRVLDCVKKAGIAGHGYFIIGFPGETEETVKETVAYAENLVKDGLLESCFFHNFTIRNPVFSEIAGDPERWGVDIREIGIDEYFSKIDPFSMYSWRPYITVFPEGRVITTDIRGMTREEIEGHRLDARARVFSK